MKLIITSVVAIVFIAVGSFAGVILKTPTTAAASSSAVDDGDDHGDDHADDHGKKKESHGKDGYEKSSGDSSYYKFSREFVVPIMRGGQVKSLVILHISLEADSATTEKLFTEEPKLRDNIMTTLIGLSNDGRTLERPTEVGNYETIRAMVLMNLKDAISDKIKNVLIVDVAKQDL